jgi:hypothetical protein
MKLVLGAALLSVAAQAAEVTFFTGSDCNQNDKLGDTISVPDESGNVEWAIFNDAKPVSMLVVGYATVLLGAETSTVFDQATCAYCANYYTLPGSGDGCAVDDGQKCVNINTGFGPGSAELIAIGEPGPQNIPCRNYLNQCDFPVPPGNGFCAQL